MIACGYPDGDDLDDLRKDPAFKLACGRLPESGGDLASQPTMSRWENAPDLRTLIRLSRGLVDLWCKSYRRPAKAITLDIDDTPDIVHGHQHLALFNAFYDERSFMPVHVYDIRRWCTDIPTILTCTIGTAMRHDDRRFLRHRFRLKSSEVALLRWKATCTQCGVPGPATSASRERCGSWRRI